ncbi:hypothetical protein BHE74_00007292 [Ensete ventricosum]|nr:hypothetical protein BHE74_00007292 [Ensete ventricosum]
MLVAGAKILEKGLKALEVAIISRLGLVLPSYTWTPGDSSLAPEGCADSSRRRLVGRKTRWSTRAGVYFWSSGELQPFEVCCDVLEGVVRPQSEDLTWLTYMSKASLFASASFCSPTDAPVIDAYTKAVVKGGRVIVSLSYFSVDLLARFLDLQETFRIYEDEMNKFRISIPKGDPFAIFSSNMFRLYSTSSSLVNVELFTFCSCAFYHHKTNNVLQYMEDETEKFQPQVAKVDGIIVQIDLIN